MTIPSNPSELFTPFLPSTYNIPEEEDRLKSFLVDNLSGFSDVINDKTIGTFIQESQSFNGEKWFYKTPRVIRNGYQAIAYISSFPNIGTLKLTLTSDPAYPINDVNSEFVVTHVWGSASKPCSDTGAGDGDYFSFMSQGDSRISFTMSNLEINITTMIDMTDYSGFIVIQYLRRGI